MYVTASIQARLGSTRLPGKVLYHLSDKRIIQWCVDRVEASTIIDSTYVAIGDEPENEAIIEYCERENIDYLIGSEEDLLNRHLSVANQTDCDLLVRITADCPFLPSNEIDRVLEHHLANESQYTTNFTENMPIGTAVDAIESDLLSELKSLGETHPVKLLRSEPGRFGTKWTDNQSWSNYSNVHLAVDTPEDYWSLVDAVEAVGSNPLEVAKWLKNST